MKLLSVNVATVGNLFITQDTEKIQVKTGIHKRPVDGAVVVRRLGLEGDEQADQSVHGGLDKAVYAYPSEHYGFWNEQRAARMKQAPYSADYVALAIGSMGENLTTEGILESDIWIGDRILVGSTVLQVTEPRHPCFKLNAKLGFPHASKMMIQSGYSGFYLRVIDTGSIEAGDAMTLMPGPREVALSWLNERRRKGRQEDLF